MIESNDTTDSPSFNWRVPIAPACRPTITITLNDRWWKFFCTLGIHEWVFYKNVHTPLFYKNGVGYGHNYYELYSCKKCGARKEGK